jgi:cysteine desulfuration protein SufE
LEPDEDNALNLSTENIPSALAEIIDDFRWSEGREKLELLLQYSERMPPLPEWLQDSHDKMDEVPECMTPVYVYADSHDNKMSFYFDIPPQSPTVRGFAAILGEGLRGSTPEQVLKIPGDFYQDMGLHQVLTHQRLNGISAILAHIKQLALRELEKESEN